MRWWIVLMIVLTCSGVVASGQMCEPVYIQGIIEQEPEYGAVFGSDVVVSGDAAFIGVYEDVVAGVRSGAVHIYRFDSDQWVFDQQVFPNDGVADQLFGVWVSVDGDSMLIGSTRDNDHGDVSGSVYAYRLVDGQWVFIQKLTASDGRAMSGFGFVTQSDGRAAIGAPGSWGGEPGALYIFEFDGEIWVEKQKLRDPDAERWDFFGVSPQLDGNRLVVGAPDSTDELLQRSGAVFVYEFDGERWGLVEKLEPDTSAFGIDSDFGYELALDGDMLFVGNPEASNAHGEIWVYQIIDDQWTLVQTLTADTTADVQWFGNAPILVRRDVLIAGGPSFDNEAGEIIVYRKMNGRWEQSAVIQSPVADANQFFGARMGWDDETLIVASPLRDKRSGMVFAYDIGCMICDADLNGDGTLGFYDVSLFLEAFLGRESVADLNGDHRYNHFDVSAFLVELDAGCP